MKILPPILLVICIAISDSSKAQKPEMKIMPIGDVLYNTTGDPNAIMKGSYSTQPIQNTFKLLNLDQNRAKVGGQTVVFENGTFRTKLNKESNTIPSHNTFIEGKGIGVTTIHVESDAASEVATFRFGISKETTDKLLRGGGMNNITLKTDNQRITKYGVMLDYVEYMQFQNVSIENFAQSALFGSFWESNFENMIIRATGAGQPAKTRIPEWGVIDFDSHSKSNIRDACNNTNFTKLTFSSCFGTHIRCVAFANTTVNINIYGLYDETYPGEGGEVDNLPIYYFKGAKNFNVVGGFLTINPTPTNRNGYAVHIAEDARNGQVSFTNFEFLQNHGPQSFAANKNNRLSSFIFLEKNQAITLSNVTINDASGSVGIGQSKRHLIDGEANSTIYLNNVQFHIKKGIWDVQNIFSPLMNKQGNITIIYYDDNGPTGEKAYYNFELGNKLNGSNR